MGLLPEDLAATLSAAGIAHRPGELRRLLAHVIARDLPGFPTARPIPRRLEALIDQGFDRQPLELVERAADPADGFEKFLFRSPDGALSEAVRIPLEKEGHYSVCLSSQVGCAMACDFCATGRMGLSRDLEAWEMVSAFLGVRRLSEGRPTGAVFMGQGEPLANLEQVVQAARVLQDPCGGRVSAPGISISTVGLVPAIRRYTAAAHPYRLVVSLTSTVEEKRRRLLPAAARWPVEELAQAIREHAAATRDRVTVAWVVLGGLNTGDDEIDGLARLFTDAPIRLNLIDVNDPRAPKAGGYARADDAELNGFRDRLRRLGVPVVRRYSGGVSAHAACGMLAAKRLES
jgi:23S rRNA (adenine2503-C2)-methyltransferase